MPTLTVAEPFQEADDDTMATRGSLPSLIISTLMGDPFAMTLSAAPGPNTPFGGGPSGACDGDGFLLRPLPDAAAAAIAASSLALVASFWSSFLSSFLIVASGFFSSQPAASVIAAVIATTATLAAIPAAPRRSVMGRF